MNAPAEVMRYARASFALRRAPPRSAPARRRQATAADAVQYRFVQVSTPGPTVGGWSRLALPCSLRALSVPSLSFFTGFTSACKGGRAAVRSVLADGRITIRLSAGALTGAIIVLAIVNNERRQPEVIGLSSVDNETIVYRHMPVQRAFTEDEGEPAADEPAEDGAASYPRPVPTIKFVNSNSMAVAEAMPARGQDVTKAEAFTDKQKVDQAANSNAQPPAREWKDAANLEEVDRYLWEVYQRAPTKRDGSGDFTWKDPAAAAHMGMSLAEYTIGGMDPDFREQLYHAGQAMDAAGIRWSMLSAFRDDYRQGLAAGFKARVGNSLHGGSRATGGYGHGRAIDITNAGGDDDLVWHWLDADGAKFGLHRPIPGRDPAHVQSRGDWHKLAFSLREGRLRAAEAAHIADRNPSLAKAKVVAKASW